MTTMSDKWRTNLILSSLRMHHKNGKVRELLAEKMPSTIPAAEKLAEAYEVRTKERVTIDRFNSALGGSSSALPVDGVAKGYWTNNSATGSTGRGCSNPQCSLRRCKGNPCQMLSLQCHTCGQNGHFSNSCPQKQGNNMQRNSSQFPPQRFSRGRFSRGVPQQGRGRMIGEAYAGYMEQSEQQQFETAWQQPTAFLPEFNGLEYDVPHNAYLATDQVYRATAYPTSYPYRAPSIPSTPMSTSRSQAGPMYHPTGEMQILSVDVNESVSSNPREWWHQITAVRTGRSLPFKMDTGAHGNVIALRDLYKLGFLEHDLQDSNVFLRTFSQAVVQPLGALVTEIVVNKRRFHTIFHVVPHYASLLFSMQDILRAGLLELPPDAFTERPPDMMATEEFNAYRYETVHLQLRADAVLKQFPPRRVPLALERTVREALQRMEADKIIEQVKYPTPWCNSLMVTPKPDGSLRVCLDPRYLNQYLVRPIYPFPDVDQIFSRVWGHKFFAKIDLTSGFWNLKLDPASTDLCTFATPWGRYKFLRLPFGVSPAPEVFHRIVADLIKDLPGIIHYIEDILIMARTRAEHDRLVAIVLKRLADAGFAVNEAKSEFGKSSIPFLGHVVSGDGIRPDPGKLEALRSIRPPRNLSELQSLMGFLNFLGRYIPQFAALAEPIRRVQSKRVLFDWGSEQQAAFERIREHLLTSPVLIPFDPDAPLTVATDASNAGLGGVLLQYGRPVMFVARSLTLAESRYAAIEKELLAVRYVLERCRFYTYGRPVTLQTDHKPLLGLAESDLDRVSLRMRRMLEKLFVFDIKWEYVPGAQNIVADFLSRMPSEASTVEVNDSEAEMLSRADARLLSSYLSVHPFFQQVAAATAKDPTLSTIHRCLSTSWRTHARGDVATYWPVRHELRVLGPFVVYRDRLCVPKDLQATALAFLHVGHPGVVHMQERARQLLFWPRITRDVYDFVLACVPCARVASARPKEPMLPSPVPTGPGDHVAADFCVWHSRRFLIFYDLFSHFPFLFPVQRETAHELLRCTRQVFLQTGLPTIFASDNGGAFASAEFQHFLRSCGTTHRASSPRYPQSNGAAERSVQLIKRLLERSTTEEELFDTLLRLQNTRRPDLGVSPAELFFSRRQRTPITPHPSQCVRPWSVQCHRLQRNHVTQAKYYDQHVRSFQQDLSGCKAILRDFVGPVVSVSVLSPAPAPRAYYVRLPSGVVTIRNQAFLRPLPRSPAPQHAEPTTRSHPAAPPPLRTTVHSESGSPGRNASLLWDTLSPERPTAFHRQPTSVRTSQTGLPPISAPDSTASPPRSPTTAFRSSSVHGSHGPPSGAWASASSDQFHSPSPPLPTSPVTARPSPLGATRTGRLVFPPLRAR
jgi:transposase InsO family protein